MNAPPNAAIAARGIPISLSDGRIVRLRYGMEGLLDLEDRFGSVARTVPYVKGSAAVMARDLGMASEEEMALAATYSGPGFLRVITTSLAAGLHEVGLSDPLNLIPLIDTRNLRDYVMAVVRAYEEAFQAGDVPAPDGGGDPLGDPTRGGSPSLSGGTPPSDDAPSGPMSSGG